ncbi:MAG: ATP-binding cassette domain-containing protein [Acutalibacteraceae bacterium]
MKIIETEKLTKYYGKNRGIIDLDLSVEEGEFFGFIGPNGAGKSTTIRILLGLIRTTAGEAKLFGKDLKSDRNTILRNIGYMPSEATFYSGMKVKDILSLSAKMRQQDCRKEAEQLCERLALDREKRVEELSLGNRKKVSVVCALQHKPRLCILDEPTSGLDPLMQKEFFDILRERHREGCTIFLSSHILSEIQKNCSRAAIIKEGRLVALDSVENLSKTNARRVTLHGVSSLPADLTAKSVEAGEDSVSFLFSGDIRHLLKVAGTLPIVDMTITEPDLEEIFMHYYEKGGESK